MILTKINSGSVLLAEPSLLINKQFQRSVVLIAEYSQNGVIGFITNKPLCLTISEILPDITEEFRIYSGGPVEKENLYFLHTCPHLIPNSIKISDGVYWGGDFNIVAGLITSKRITPCDIKFFLGYTGWHYNQLHDEINKRDWIVQSETFSKSLIKDNTDCFWKKSLNSLGGEYLLWSNAPENPSHN